MYSRPPVTWKLPLFILACQPFGPNVLTCAPSAFVLPETKLSETIYNVFSTIASNIDINADDIEEFVMRTSAEMIEKNIMKEEAYIRKSKKMEKDKGKSLGPYDKYYNETLIIIIASVFIVAVQTAIPGFKPHKTFPGCVRSFSGFPMGGIEDITGIKYIACVLHKIKSQVSPWDAI